MIIDNRVTHTYNNNNNIGISKQSISLHDVTGKYWKIFRHAWKFCYSTRNIEE